MNLFIIIFLQYTEALKVTINKLYINRRISLTYYLRFNICRWTKTRVVQILKIF